MIRVLLADDHELVREGIKNLLEQASDITVTAQACNGLQAKEEYKRVRPDVTVLDVTMPGLDGLETVKHLMVIDDRAQILMLTVHPERYYAVRLLKAGALGYITKDSSSAELHAAVRTVAQGKRFLSQQGVEEITARLFTSRSETAIPREDLSDRELQVLCAIARGDRIKDIAQELGVGTKTVETYRYRLLRKLGLSSNAHLCRFAFENGLVDITPASHTSPAWQ